MKIPFTTEQFYEVFEKYNEAIFPLQWIILLLGFASLLILRSRIASMNSIMGWFLGLLWIWVGTVYHLSFFTTINKAAWGFGALFIIEGILLLINAMRSSLVFDYSGQTKDKAGYFLVLFALFIYPVIGYLVEWFDGQDHSFGAAMPVDHIHVRISDARKTPLPALPAHYSIAMGGYRSECRH